MRQIPRPDLFDLFESNNLDIFAKFNCHRLGVVQSFNTENQTASVKLVDKTEKQTYNGNIEFSSLLLADVPVFINSDGSKGFERPISEGEECLVLFNDRDIDKWFEYGNIDQRPNSSRMHSLSDGLAIVGFHSKLKRITDFSNDLTRMRYEDTVIELDDKVNIQNAAKTLKEICDNLMDVLAGALVDNQVPGNKKPFTTETIAALNDVKSQFNELLK